MNIMTHEEVQDVKRLGTAKILSVILIEGFVTIAVEMLTIRQLIPVVGNSVVITSLIVGVFLLFLALGYYRGGSYCQNYYRVLKKNFTYSACLLGIGLSYLFIQFFFSTFYSLISQNTLLILVLYLLIITSPLVYLLGQTVPITTNLFKYEHHVGGISGRVLSISTLGSFLGSVFTTLVLMNFLGVAWTVFSNYLLLFTLTLLLSDFRVDLLRILLLTLAGIILFILNVGVENKLFVKTTNYGDYAVVKNYSYGANKGTLFSINNSTSSFLATNKTAFEYIEVIKRILFQDLALRNKEILVLGTGGFTLSAQGNYGNFFTYVDIDGAIPEIVRQGFVDTIIGKFVAEDARKFLMNTSQKFDAIVSDVYSNHHTIPFHLLTQEYFQSIKNSLRPGGVAIFNIIANPTFQDNYSKRVDNTIKSVFRNCMSEPINFSNGPNNIIYICSTSANTDRTIYTDNKNTSMLDIFKEN